MLEPSDDEGVLFCSGPCIVGILDVGIDGALGANPFEVADPSRPMRLGILLHAAKVQPRGRRFVGRYLLVNVVPKMSVYD